MEVFVNGAGLFNTPNREKLVRPVRGFCLCMHTSRFKKMLAKAGFSGYKHADDLAFSCSGEESETKAPPARDAFLLLFSPTFREKEWSELCLSLGT